MAEGAKLLIDDIDSEFLEDCKRALDNFGGFESYELFAEVFYRAVCLVLQYNATPESLHLYLNELTDKTGKKLECAELEFLYLQVLRFFSGYAFAEITPDGWRGIYHREWNDALISCTPCACDYTAASCECEKVNKMSDGRYDEADEESCSCHSWSHRNLNHLIYPITESGDFDDLKRRLELLPDNRERLILLMEEKAEYEQQFGGQKRAEPSHEDDWDIGFAEKCRIEIELLEKKIQLQGGGDSNVNGANDEYDPAKRGLTRQLAMMLLDELFPNLANAPNVAKAGFLELLTGWDKDGLRNKWSDYRLGNRERLKADMKTVQEWKMKLKISDDQN